MNKPRYLTLSARAFELALTLSADQQAAFNKAIWGMYQALLNGDPAEPVQHGDPLLSIILDMASEELVSGFNTYMQRVCARKSSERSTDVSPANHRSIDDAPAIDNKSKRGNRKEPEETGFGQEEEQTDQGFDRFWSLYPLRVSQAEARKAWVALKPDAALVDNILRGLELWIGSDEWRRDGGKYIPHPQNFLLKQRWLDEPRKLKAVPSVPAQDFRQRDYQGVEQELLANLSNEIAAAKAQGII